MDILQLPLPRLQFRWEKDGDTWESRICHYELILPLREHDIRREREYDDNGNLIKELPYLTIPISSTKVSGGIHKEHMTINKHSTPFRDGAHAIWDNEVLKMPIWIVCGEQMVEWKIDNDIVSAVISTDHLKT